VKRFHLNLDLSSVIVVIAVGVLLPVLLSTAVGIVALVFARDAGGIVTGVLVICFAIAATGSALITVILASKKARLARLQSDFIASVSHEFRTPLSAIRLYAQTLQSGKLDNDPEQMGRCLATILRETEWLDVMVDRVLTWRASSKDILELSPEPAPVAQAVNGAVERFQSMVDPGGMALDVTIDSHRPVRHDARALNAVVLNLLTNAYKYTGEDKRIHVRVRDADEDVVIAVEDNGMGLTEAEMKHVFQPFYRAHGPDGEERGGVGLGLAIAQYLVDRQKGQMSVDSVKGGGTTFVIRFPAETESP